MHKVCKRRTGSCRRAGDLASPSPMASSSEQEIALLKQQLKLLEQKLDKLQSQTAANTAATAKAKADTLNVGVTSKDIGASAWSTHIPSCE